MPLWRFLTEDCGSLRLFVFFSADVEKFLGTFPNIKKKLCESWHSNNLQRFVRNQNLGTTNVTLVSCYSRPYKTHFSCQTAFVYMLNTHRDDDQNELHCIHLQDTSVNIWELVLGKVDCQVVNFLIGLSTPFFLFPFWSDWFHLLIKHFFPPSASMHDVSYLHADSHNLKTWFDYFYSLLNIFLQMEQIDQVCVSSKSVDSGWAYNRVLKECIQWFYLLTLQHNISMLSV